MKKQLLFILLTLLPACIFAQESVLERIIADVQALGGTPEVVIEQGTYAKVRLADSCYLETYHFGDSILLVQTVCAQAPKLNPHIPAMQACLAEVMGVEPDTVSIKATTTEHLGFVGREEGIAAYAVVLLRPTLTLPTEGGRKEAKV